MYQFSDSDSVDSDDGIRYKTESIRNKKFTEKKGHSEKDRDRHSHRGRNRSRSRSKSRSRHHSDRKKLKRRDSPEDKSHRKSTRSKHRESDRSDDKKHRKEKVKSKKDSTNDPVLRHTEETHSDKPLNKTVTSEECSTFGPSLPRKEPDPEMQEKPTNNLLEAEDNVQSLPFGPTLPPKVATPTNSESTDEEQSQNGNTFGPQLPPHLTKKSATEDNVIGPLLPSHFITVSSLEDDSSMDVDSSNIQNNKDSSSQNNVIGPALPPNILNKSDEDTIGPELPPQSQQIEEEESEDEEVYGPVPDGAHYSQVHIELEERALKMKMDQMDASGNEQPVREEWMLSLPESKASNFGLGPRQFRRKAGPDLSDRSSWTDTPEDKAKKKEGKVEPVIDLKREAELKHIQNRNMEQEKIAKVHKKDKDSLLEIHRKKLKKEKKNESGPSERRPFSREVDLQVNRFDDAQKQAVLKKAQLLDNRFSSGESKFL